MTDKEKAQAYDNVVNKLKKFIQQGVEPLITKNDVQDFFPELAESNSEDERIRKSLIRNYTNQHSSNFPTADGFTREQILAWLEKQGKSALEVIHEQKPNNKPKFNVGDWIVFNGLILLVNEVVQGYYRTISIGGIRNSYDWDIDNMARLWTLQEAKDGDVLTVKDRPFIYNGEVNPLSVGGYCGIDINNIFKINEERLGYGSQGWTMFDGDIYPATKEQRELLFQKMKKSGYTFNFEKKELKKIPNALEIEHVEHGKYYYCIKDYYSGGCKRASKGEVVKALRGMSMMALGAEANKYFIPVKRIVDVKHAWSEEDEDMIQALNACIDAVIKSGMNYISFDSKSILIGKVKNWLKSLRPQNH